MKYSELVKILKRNGCSIRRHGGKHDLWYSPISDKVFPVARHLKEDVPLGTVRSIEKMSGINVSGGK